MAFTKRMWKFGIKKRDMTQITRELRMVCIRKRERLTTERLDNAWDTSYTHSDDNGNYTVSNAGGDTVSFISTAHTREDGGTNWNNEITDGTTVNMDADYDAIKAMHRTGSLVKDGKGNLMNLNYDKVVVARGSTPFFKFQEILGAIKRGYKAVSTDRDGSGVQAFELIALPYLANTNYWFGFDSSKKNEIHGLQYLESQPIELEGPNVVFKTNEIQYKSTVMFDIGHNDARNWAGSKGTNA